MPRAEILRASGFGLSIESDCAVPGAIADAAADTFSPDLRIATLPHLAADAVSEPVYRWDGGTLTFSAPGVARYTCRRDTIRIAAVEGADPAMVTALLIATALPAVMWLRGGAMLHAAGVVAPSARSALAIAGPSGAGKSTLAAALLDDGGALLADDSICLRATGGVIEGSGLAGGYHLRADDGEDRDFHALPPARSVRAAPMHAVVILARTDGASTLTRLSPVEALVRLLANRHRPAIAAIIGTRGAALATMALLADNAAVYEWHRPSAALSVTEREMLAREGLW